MGQSKPVRVYRLVARDTVDEKILRLCLRKSHVSEHVLDANTIAKRAASRGADAAPIAEGAGDAGDQERVDGAGAGGGGKGRTDDGAEKEHGNGEEEEGEAGSDAEAAQAEADSGAEDGPDEDVAIAEDVGIRATAVSSKQGSLAAQILGQEAAAAAAREGERDQADSDDEGGEGTEAANEMMELLGSELARLNGS